jgi:aryl-alcohol dehydrogenase-like predicted oxidoreductase
MRAQLDESLRRLQVDMIELYHVHSVAPGSQVEDIVGALSEQVGAGKIRHIGLSG